jgi:chromosome segregation ATPase
MASPVPNADLLANGVPSVGDAPNDVDARLRRDSAFLRSLHAESSEENSPAMAIQRENAELRSIIAELKQALEEARSQQHDMAGDRQREYESLLEEKSELIRGLHLKIHELQDGHHPAATPKEEELIALSEELDRERCQLQQERRQLEDERKQLMEDEQMMTKQMRDMEVQMARERADFARQRIELNRIYEDIRREMDNIERNGLLNQRLNQLRTRFQETVNPSGSSPSMRPGSNPAVSPAPPREPAPANPPPGGKRRESFIGRIFG